MPGIHAAPPLGRPRVKHKWYDGDRRGMVAEGALMGPSFHGVVSRPVREYYENGRTLVAFEPVDPQTLTQNDIRELSRRMQQ